MEIRSIQDAGAIAPQPKRKPIARSPEEKPSRRDPDRYAREEREAREAPFWLLRMAADRMARRRYLRPRERKACLAIERAWISALAQAAAPGLAGWEAGHADRRLADWQALAGHLSACAELPPPRVVWQPALREGRGQFWFRVEGSLVRLNPNSPGSAGEWVATVAHEVFHHLQQELVSAFYRGEPLTGDRAQLAAYYRDARSTYELLGPGCPPERHREQDLERGAWAFGAAIARLLLP